MQKATLEKILQTISRVYISLPDDQVIQMKNVIEEVVDMITEEMMKESSLFKTLYIKPFYSGSFYDDLYVGQPERIEVNLVLGLPKMSGPAIIITEFPGFVKCKVNNPDVVTDFKLFIDSDKYVKNKNICQWLQKLISRAMNSLSINQILTVENYKVYTNLYVENMTMKLYMNTEHLSLDIDFIPCFVFDSNHWPAGMYQLNPVPKKPEFFIGALSPKIVWPQNDNLNDNLLWCLLFPEQERELINVVYYLKPALKIMKRLRNHQHHAISSYCLKTMFMLEHQLGCPSFYTSQNRTLTATFLIMLDKYIEWLEKGLVPYYWFRRQNLLNVPDLTAMTNYLKFIRRDITSHPEDPLIICRYLGAPLKLVKSEAPD